MNAANKTGWAGLLASLAVPIVAVAAAVFPGAAAAGGGKVAADAVRPAPTTTVAPTTTSTAPTTTSTTVPAPTTTTTVAPAPTTTVAPPPQPARVFTTASPTPPAPSNYGCGPALAYLQTHSAPGFTFECPGYSLGHQAMTCINVSGVCPGAKLIVITIPCSAAYMNEAHNSWVLSGLQQGSIDPYGYCH